MLSVWFIASRGHHFALGTGGLKLSLLVGGLGPVYSLPKYCFKPFRKLNPHFYHEMREANLLVMLAMLAGHAGDVENDADDVDGLA